ncbi:MAG: glycosyltransferase [Phycisphaerae bacterium]
MSKKVLIVAAYFPPLAEVGSQRPARLCRHLPRHGWSPHVLTVAADCCLPRDDSLMELVPSDLPIDRTPCRSWLAHTYHFRRRTKSRLKRLLTLPVHAYAYWREFACEPDVYMFWRRGAVRRAVELHRRGAFDVVFASLNPWSAALICQDIFRACGAPYVLDYRDPWSLQTEHDRFQDPARKERERGLERAALADAAAVVSVTRGIAQLYEAGFADELRGKSHVVTNSFDADEWTGVPPHRFDRFTLLHGGNIHATRSLKPIMRGLAALRRRGVIPDDGIQLVNYGNVSADERAFAAEAGVQSWVRFEPVVPRTRFVAMLLGAEMLLVTERWPFVVPGKTYDYLATGRPVLAVVPRGSQIAELIADADAGLVVPEEEPEAMADTLLAAWQNHRAGRPIYAVRDPEARLRYSTPHTSRQLATILDSVLERSRGSRSADLVAGPR